MSSRIVSKIIIDVTKGDCCPENRKSGKSNTGTYFLCSVKDYHLYEDYVKEGNKYIINMKKVASYQVIFNHYFKSKKEQYIGKMSKFDSCCNYLLSQNTYNIDIVLRKNDSRVFFRFKNNNAPIVNSFRNLLYEDISKIAIEKKDNYYEIYPVIIDENIDIDIDYSKSDFLFDE